MLGCWVNSRGGLYGPYADGCSYWWDGAQWTGEYSCTGSGTAGGWYGPFQDGGYYEWDGYQWTAQDCSQAATYAYPAGWYGPFQDGCYYEWDGVQFTGAANCDYAPLVTGQIGWYGPYDDGCYYYWDGAQWSSSQCGPTSQTLARWYGPYADGCYYWWDGTTFSGQFSCTVATEQPGTILIGAVPDLIGGGNFAVGGTWDPGYTIDAGYTAPGGGNPADLPDLVVGGDGGSGGHTNWMPSSVLIGGPLPDAAVMSPVGLEGIHHANTNATRDTCRPLEDQYRDACVGGS